jgi:hypothetical protein
LVNVIARDQPAFASRVARWSSVRAIHASVDVDVPVVAI